MQAVVVFMAALPFAVAPALAQDAFSATFDGDKMTLEKPGKGKQEGTFRLDPAASPKAVDLTPAGEKNREATLAGIYRLEGDTLKLCLPTLPGRVRPTEFASTPGHWQVLVLTRERK